MRRGRGENGGERRAGDALGLQGERDQCGGDGRAGRRARVFARALLVQVGGRDLRLEHRVVVAGRERRGQRRRTLLEVPRLVQRLSESVSGPYEYEHLVVCERHVANFNFTLKCTRAKQRDRDEMKRRARTAVMELTLSV